VLVLKANVCPYQNIFLKEYLILATKFIQITTNFESFTIHFNSILLTVKERTVTAFKAYPGAEIHFLFNVTFIVVLLTPSLS